MRVHNYKCVLNNHCCLAVIFIIEAKQLEKNQRPGRKVVHLFTGIVFCGCGGKMYASNSPKYICWQCRKKIPIDDLETIYREQLKQYFVNTSTASSLTCMPEGH
ncbi:MAG: zinc ribbon domain-containing protein [Nitrososphaera sp.]|nr:zinc ribbon domain-containing protein [Nitrososphaera sp.]